MWGEPCPPAGVGSEGAEVNFNVKSIYAVNKSAFGPERKYEVPVPPMVAALRRCNRVSIGLEA